MSTKRIEPPAELLDEHGYPTAEWLEYLEAYDPATHIPVGDLVQEIKDGWWCADALVKMKDVTIAGEQRKILELHTGGWSGNETIIDSILKNMALSYVHLRYVKWEIGGHYYFEIIER